MNLHSILFHLVVGRLKLCVLITLVSMTSALSLHAETMATKSSPVVTNSVNTPVVAATKSSVASAPITNGPATNAPATNAPATNAPTIFSLKLGPDAADDDDDTSATKGGPHSATIKINDHDDKESSWMPIAGITALLIPLAGIICSFGTPVLIVFLICYFRYRRRRENLGLVREYLSKGLPIPPQLLDESLLQRGDPVTITPITRGRSDLRRGIKYVAIGVGVCLALYVNNPHSTTWAWGLIVLVMGLGFLASGWIETRTAPKSDETAPPPPSLGGPR